MAIALRGGYPLFAFLLAALGLGAPFQGPLGPLAFVGAGIALGLLFVPEWHSRLRGQAREAVLARVGVFMVVAAFVLLGTSGPGQFGPPLASTVVLTGYFATFGLTLRMAKPDPRRRRAGDGGGSDGGGGDYGSYGDAGGSDASDSDLSDSGAASGCGGFVSGSGGDDSNDGDGDGSGGDGGDGGGDGGGGDGGGGGD